MSYNGSYFIDIAAAQITGDLPAPAVLQVTFATAPNRMFLRVHRRTRGTSANWKSTYEAESASGDGTTPSNDAAASGASNNFRHFTFTAINQEKTCTWTESTNPADKVGRVDAYAVIKDQASLAGNFACSLDLAIGGVPARSGKQVTPVFSHLSGAAYECVYLDTFDIPTTPVPSTWTWTFKTHRTVGTDAVDLDRLILLPHSPDEAAASLDWTSLSDISGSSNKTFTLDAVQKRAWYGTPSIFYAPARFTSGLYLLPGVDNRIILEPSADAAWPTTAVPKHTVSPISSATLTFTPKFSH